MITFPSNKGQAKLFEPYDLPDTHPSPNDSELPLINTVVQEFKDLALHTQSEVENRTSGCIVCGTSYEQVLEETAADYLLRTAEARETIRDRHMRRQSFLASFQNGVVTFIPRGVSQDAVCDGVIYSINNRNATQDPQGNVFPLFQD